uniref:Regulator of chromosome condensation (RCC1) repeat, putative n=1 Tax=Theileria annulata TaxID=5874 RepID=A0A3B0MK95_THEAN
MFVKYLFKRLKIYYFYPIFKLTNTFTFCDSNTFFNNNQNVYMFGYKNSLPEGLNNHKLFQTIDKNSKLYIWGSNKENIYVIKNINNILDNINNHNTATGSTTGTEVTNTTNTTTKNTTTSTNGPVTVTENEKIKFEMEEIKEFGNKLLYNNPKIIRMNIGQYHNAFISDDGTLYCSGNNEYGQCGQKPKQLYKDSTFLIYKQNNIIEHIPPTKVKFKENVKIKDVVCGLTHTICIDTNNNIYSFGDDNKIQLFFGESRGKSIFEHRYYKSYLKYIYNFSPINTSTIIYNNKEKHLQYVPIKINNLSFLKNYENIIKNSIINLQAGNYFTIISITPINHNTNGSIIIGSGNNEYGQCGSMDPMTTVPKKIKISNKYVKQLSCGSSHCLLLTHDNYIYYWGDNKFNQLNQNKKKIIIPEKLKMKENEEIKYIKCSYNNSVIITKTI